MGPMTLRAIENFQRNHGLDVDGIVGPITKAALTAALTAIGAPIAKNVRWDTEMPALTE
jgi:peptidoglycan hydrolase-like protein with peptidoglycan-binding domain